RGYAAEPEVSSEFLEHALWARGDWGQKFELQVAELGKWLGTLFAKSIGKGDLPQTVDVGTTITTFFAIYYFELIIQIKQRFVEVEPGVARLRKQIENQFQGL
ncbi:MAG: hypothetical protein P1V35_12885, partial [Planctomycetota bacterium]|nr:hypothetical protein [Planctomycetota bacterium]